MKAYHITPEERQDILDLVNRLMESSAWRNSDLIDLKNIRDIMDIISSKPIEIAPEINHQELAMRIAPMIEKGYFVFRNEEFEKEAHRLVDSWLKK